MGRKATWKWLILLAAVLGIAGSRRDLRSDVLVTKSGKRWVGSVTDEGNAYSVKKANGTSLRFPKSMVKEVIDRESLRRHLEAMKKSADLTNEGQLVNLLKYANEHDLKDEKRRLILFAGRQHWSKAKDDPDSLRELSDWCNRYGLTKQASACEQRANELYQADFRKRHAAAGGDAVRLEALAEWCKARNMTSAVRTCLEPKYRERSGKARTPRAIWELSLWCDRWHVGDWRDQQRLRAIKAAQSRKDSAVLQAFLESLEKNHSSDECLVTCRLAIYAVRREGLNAASDTDARALASAQLATWCEKHGLKTEAEACRAEALARRPEDPRVRAELGYVKDPVSGKWRRGIETSLGICTRSERRQTVLEESPIGRGTALLQAPAGKQYVILHFITDAEDVSYSTKDYVLSDAAGHTYLPQGISKNRGQTFSAAQKYDGFSKLVPMKGPRHSHAIYFQVPEPAGTLVLKYKGTAMSVQEE